jgi:hypothetical protein
MEKKRPKAPRVFLEEVGGGGLQVPSTLLLLNSSLACGWEKGSFVVLDPLLSLKLRSVLDHSVRALANVTLSARNNKHRVNIPFVWSGYTSFRDRFILPLIVTELREGGEPLRSQRSVRQESRCCRRRRRCRLSILDVGIDAEDVPSTKYESAFGRA